MTQPPGQFDYFVLRLIRSRPSGPITGLAERLRTGEKRSFDSGDQLLRLIDAWSPHEGTGSPHSHEEGMMNPTEPARHDKAMDLDPKVIKPESADQVRGGRAGGDDDDLEELQVERKTRPR
jgi:hypothetical protein